MLGYSHDDFFDQTPRTLSLTFQAYNDRLMYQHNERAWLAWHTAALQRTKTLPQLQTLLAKKQSQADMEDQLEGLKRWVQAAGGKILYKQ
jgi:hypothetical protein